MRRTSPHAASRRADDADYFLRETTMRLAALLLLTLTVSVGHVSSAFGQYGFWPYGGYATTPGEGAAMGMAAMVQSAGMATMAAGKAAESTAQAASTFEDARSKYMDNQIKYTQVYTERQRFLQSQREAKRRPPPSAEQLYRISQQRLPKTLSPSQLDPVTGAISWPVVLRDESFDSYREAAQKFFHDTVANPQTFSYDSYSQVQEASGECLALLKSRIKDYRPNDYIQAKNFVESLTYAAQQL
ncbi:MAG: hypothetical protein B7Z73_18655 [Planctomycetia bacterium 21-64-5]|nr:MAG: hypothetical protein B7Z73_18655 [Planctomycetia bacterium 21-64-5]